MSGVDDFDIKSKAREGNFSTRILNQLTTNVHNFNNKETAVTERRADLPTKVAGEDPVLHGILAITTKNKAKVTQKQKVVCDVCDRRDVPLHLDSEPVHGFHFLRCCLRRDNCSGWVHPNCCIDLKDKSKLELPISPPRVGSSKGCLPIRPPRKIC